MEHNDQVLDGPFNGESGEIKKESSKEENSAPDPSVKKEKNIPETTENADASSGAGNDSAKSPNPGEKSPDTIADTESHDETPAVEVEPAVKPEGKELATSESTSESKEKLIPESESESKAKAVSKAGPKDKKKPASKTAPGDTPPPEAAKPDDEGAGTADDGSKTPAEAPSSGIPEFDYSALTREDLINRLEILIENQDVQEIRSDVDHIKINFYKKNKAEIELKRKKFIEEGGDIEDFQVKPDGLEDKIKELLKKYREQKTEYNRNLELEKQENLARKYEVIEKIKELVNRKESINKTFNEFRELQVEWRMIGLVPQQNLKDLWDTYNHHVEKFYDYIKINKELRDLDLKKNLELKMQLCERAEELLMETSVINAFKSLQKYHDRWREIGPVPLEVRAEIWERFKEATSKINRRHQEYFEELKRTQKKNLEQKTMLCEKAEEISNLVLETHKQWDDKSKELIELQKVWKTIGFAPKKDNNKIYERFRRACDAFFSRKREFYSQNKEMQLNNLQLKTDLCFQAEALQNSTEWKKNTDDLISLQKKWKEIGPVPKKHSEAIWRRFRAACDHFFKKKSEYFQNIDQTYSHNLEEKKKLLKELESLELTENVENNFKILNDFQRRWAEIGFVPFKEKEALQDKFRKLINTHFDSLDINENRKNLLKFRNKLNSMIQKPKFDAKITQERERYLNRLQQLKNDIVLWENNIGFFAKSKNAESMIDEVQSKIDNAKESMKLLEQKIEMIDNLDTD